LGGCSELVSTTILEHFPGETKTTSTKESELIDVTVWYIGQKPGSFDDREQYADVPEKSVALHEIVRVFARAEALTLHAIKEVKSEVARVEPRLP
jgi:hypothetical protein